MATRPADLDDAISALSEQPSTNVSERCDNTDILVRPGDPDRESTLSAQQPEAVNPGDREPAAATTTLLHRSQSTLFLASLFASFAIVSWVITCILAHRTITLGHYDIRIDDGCYYDKRARQPQSKTDYQNSENWFRATRVIQSVLATLVIPVTSAVCAKAAVVFMQRSCSGLSLRQTMVLADKGWMSPQVIFNIPSRKDYRIHGSSFLIFAILLNFLGFMIAPLQSIFLTARTIKTPTRPASIYSQTDIMDLMHDQVSDYNLVPVQVRNTLTSIRSIEEPQARLWTRHKSNSSSNNLDNFLYVQDDSSLGSIADLQDPFLSELSPSFTSGLIRQFMFRVNSSVSRENISSSDFPVNCKDLPGAFYASYGDIGPFTYVDEGNWTITACMPANQTFSPWKPVRSRQDFSEVLYLQLSVDGWLKGNDYGTFKITTNTTGGYFELPNYMNGNSPGPLLSDDPSYVCGDDYIGQATTTTTLGRNNMDTHLYKRDEHLVNREFINSTSYDAAHTLQVSGRNRGPLLTVAIALFGEGSFLSERLRHPDAYTEPNTKDELARNPALGACIGQMPFVNLLRDSTYDYIPDVGMCLTNIDAENAKGLQNQLATYTQLFIGTLSGDRLTRAFTAAMFLANEAWLLSSMERNLEIYYDYGVDTLVPAISLAGIILISILLGTYLICLLALAVYGSRTPLWTERLDSFAMMRLGAYVLGDVPLKVGKAEKVKVLDEIPGWLGDANGDGDSCGELALGARDRLTEKRRYKCYSKELNANVPGRKAI